MDYTSQWGSDRHIQRGKELVAGIFRDKLFYKRESLMRKPRHREVKEFTQGQTAGLQRNSYSQAVEVQSLLGEAKGTKTQQLHSTTSHGKAMVLKSTVLSRVEPERSWSYQGFGREEEILKIL